MRTAGLALAAVAAFAAPTLAADESLALQPSATSTGPGGSVEIQVLAKLFPGGKAVIPVRVADVILTSKGGGTVAPASENPGEVKWVYKAPDAVAANLDVTIEGHIRSYPDAAGACVLRVNAPAPPAPVPPPGATKGAKPAPDDDGDLVEDAKGEAADPVGKLITLEKWKARTSEDDPWKEKPLPPRGEPLVAMAIFQEFHFRVNAGKVASVEIRWWRDDLPNRVRTFSEKNRRLDLSRDQDGLVHGAFGKGFEKAKAEFTFAIIVHTEDGKTLKENLSLRHDSPEKGEKKK